MEGEEPEPTQTQKPAPSSWAQRTGYSVRAPSERVRAEVQDSHRRDEAAQHRLAVQQRQRGLAHVRASSSHRLGGAGAPAGAAASVREARMPFVAQAEMDGNPRIQKMQKRLQAQREQKERAEERERKEQERLKKLQERRGIDMVANRAVNRAKQEHWQQWDAANSHMQASSSTPVVVEGHLSEGNLMQGTWHLDTKTFHIVRPGPFVSDFGLGLGHEVLLPLLCMVHDVVDKWPKVKVKPLSVENIEETRNVPIMKAPPSVSKAKPPPPPPNMQPYDNLTQAQLIQLQLRTMKPEMMRRKQEKANNMCQAMFSSRSLTYSSGFI